MTHDLKALDARRQLILETLGQAGQLTPELEQKIKNAENKMVLADLYFPFRPKRGSHLSFDQIPGLDVLLESPELNGELRELLWQQGTLVVEGETKQNASELIRKIPAHRVLALFRARREGTVKLAVMLTDAQITQILQRIAEHLQIPEQNRSADQIALIQCAWEKKIFPKLTLEVLLRLRERADEESIRSISQQLTALLMAPPAGEVTVLALVPGQRSGLKAAIVGPLGQVLETAVLYPFAGQNTLHQTVTDLAKLLARYPIEMVALAQGSGARETEGLLAELNKMYPDLIFNKIRLNNLGASSYATSSLAKEQLGDLEPALREAVFIARKLQDPLKALIQVDVHALAAGFNQAVLNPVRLMQVLKTVCKECADAVAAEPGSDPRGTFKMVQFQSGLSNIQDLKLEMKLEGIVTQVTTYGAFVDVGVGQNGLVHISALSNRFVADPHSLVKAGDIVKVRVIELDEARARIGLSMKDPVVKPAERRKPVQMRPPKKMVAKPVKAKNPPSANKLFNTAMADAFAKLKQGGVS